MTKLTFNGNMMSFNVTVLHVLNNGDVSLVKIHSTFEIWLNKEFNKIINFQPVIVESQH